MAVPVARMSGPRTEQGVALITALLVVALATVAAAAMASRQQFDVRRTANILDGDQAYAYALAVESWGRVILARDADDNDRDHLDETWAKRLAPIGVPGGVVDGHISDLQGRYNLNNLIGQDGQLSQADLAYLQRLLRILELNEGLALAIADWVDADFDTRFPDGGEDEYYLSTQLPYRTANRPLQSISELRLIRGIDAEVWQKLVPLVCVLPVRTPLNVNTASAPLLQALVEELTTSDGEKLVEARGETGYDSVELFLQQEVFAGRPLEASTVSVASQFFLIRASISVGTARSELFSLVQRSANGLATLTRTQGTW